MEKEVKLILNDKEITAVGETVDKLIAALSTRKATPGGVGMDFLNVLTKLKFGVKVA